MKSTSTDPRAMRTRQNLREGLMETVVKKPFREITINDIATSAGVNRATFYLHYEDKYDLLNDTANTLVKEIRGEVENDLGFDPTQMPHLKPFAFHQDRMTILLHHFKKHREFYLAVMGKNGGESIFFNLFRNGASEWIKSTMRAFLHSQNKEVDEDFIDMMVRFQSAGNFDVIMWWLEHDTHVPIDVMAERMARVTLPPLFRLIQGDDYQY